MELWFIRAIRDFYDVIQIKWFAQSHKIKQNLDLAVYLALNMGLLLFKILTSTSKTFLDFKKTNHFTRKISFTYVKYTHTHTHTHTHRHTHEGKGALDASVFTLKHHR